MGCSRFLLMFALAGVFGAEPRRDGRAVQGWRSGVPWRQHGPQQSHPGILPSSNLAATPADAGVKLLRRELLRGDVGKSPVAGEDAIKAVNHRAAKAGVSPLNLYARVRFYRTT